MVTLAPMPKEDFQCFETEFTSTYADDNVRIGHWPASSALVQAQEEFRRQLPSGLRTPGHRIYNICKELHQ